jgi:hypothetical protein
MAYLTNNQRLDLGLVGQSDRSVGDIQAAMGAGSTYYVEGVVAPPKAAPGPKGGVGAA